MRSMADEAEAMEQELNEDDESDTSSVRTSDVIF